MCCSHASRSRARCRAGRAACALRLRRHECREHDVSGRERRVAPAASPGGARPRSVGVRVADGSMVMLSTPFGHLQFEIAPTHTPATCVYGAPDCFFLRDTGYTYDACHAHATAAPETQQIDRKQAPAACSFRLPQARHNANARAKKQSRNGNSCV